MIFTRGELIYFILLIVCLIAPVILGVVFANWIHNSMPEDPAD